MCPGIGLLKFLISDLKEVREKMLLTFATKMKLGKLVNTPNSRAVTWRKPDRLEKQADKNLN